MWLLRTRDLILVEFTHKVPPYAILSHTWGDEEVSFQDMQKGECKHLQGYKKIEGCCALARFDGYDYAWIDTCCIDKKSSAELSEAINSMYDWYEVARICYVYLSDVSVKGKSGDPLNELTNSRWFRRGWTLQELLAPWSASFYDKEWNLIGDKLGLSSHISFITGIEQPYIIKSKSIHSASVATRMSWASNRQTTRPEDEAYCLMGIFDVNMPLLYGEKSTAFLRLQKEIARSSDDESLFAWHTEALESGIFAPYPIAFEGCGDIHPAIPSSFEQREAFTITNRGVRIDADYRDLPVKCIDGHSRFLANFPTCECVLLPLNCARKGDGRRPFYIILKRAGNDIRNPFVRFLPGENMVYEKYFNRAFRQCKEDQGGAIYIRDRFLGSVKPWFLAPVFVTTDGTEIERYALITSYITPPGWIHSASSIFGVYFGGWSGFAVLMFQSAEQDRLCITIRFLFTTHGSRNVTLDFAPTNCSVAEAVDACYAQDDLLKAIPDGHGSRSLRTRDGIEIRLKQEQCDQYFLSISRVPCTSEGEHCLSSHCSPAPLLPCSPYSAFTKGSITKPSWPPTWAAQSAPGVAAQVFPTPLPLLLSTNNSSSTLASLVPCRYPSSTDRRF